MSLTLGETVAELRRATAELMERLDEEPWMTRWLLRRKALQLWRSLDGLEGTVGYRRERSLRELGLVP